MVNFAQKLNEAKDRALETNDQLKQSWAEKNKSAYAKAYNELVEFLGLSLVRQHADATTFQLRSSTNGAVLGNRYVTQENERRGILDKANTAKDILRELPMEFRQRMLTYFMNTSFPKVAHAAAVMQTACMGKAISESLSEVTSKGKTWFEFAASERVRHFVENYATTDVMTGYYVRDLKGNPIKTLAQLDKVEGPVLITKYDERETTQIIAPGHTIHGSGISYEQPATNYLALHFPGLSIPLAVGNSVITKVPSKTPDAFAIVEMAFLHDCEQFLKEHAKEVDRHKVDLSRSSVRQAILDGLSQTVTSRGWEAFADSFRIVGGTVSGLATHNVRDLSTLPEASKSRSIYELDDENVLWVGDRTNDQLKELAKNLQSRVSSNSGMICTRIGACLVKSSMFKNFSEIVRDKFDSYDATKQIGNPHDMDTKQGALTSRAQYEGMREYMEWARSQGAKVGGGEILYDGSGGLFVRNAYTIWPKEIAHKYEEKRSHEIEIFAPLTNIVEVQDHKEAIRITNLTGKGLTAALETDSMDEITDFINETKIGSYNIGNPKLGSDNSAEGEHMGVYEGIKHNGETFTLRYNGPTGGFAHVAHQLNVMPINPKWSTWVSEKQSRDFVMAVGALTH